MKQAHDAQALLLVPGLMCDQAFWAPLQDVALLCSRYAARPVDQPVREGTLGYH